MSLLVGLSGGIGCGKTTVANMFRDRGAPIIDTDLIAHQLTATKGAAIQAIAAALGADYIQQDGAMDRSKMRSAIFADPEKKRLLESILHPLIFAEVRAQLVEVVAYPYVIIVVPLLFNSPTYLQLVQRIVVVDCAEPLQIERVAQRSGLSELEVRNIILQQTSREERLLRADVVITNEGNLAELAAQVERIHSSYFSAESQIGD
jgi:dephospho-CoA kinase